MIFNFFNTRRLKNDIQKLEENIVMSLANDFPDMAENYLHWTYVSMGQKEDKTIYILHKTSDNFYYKRNRAKHKKHFFLTGIELFNKQTKIYIPIRLTISHNLIQNIILPFDKTFRNEYDLSKIKINNIQIEDFILKNNDVSKLNKILSNISEDQKRLLEIENTFEIEVDSKFYYTILAMEDGNYIAVNKRGSVFRLIHDHEEPAKKIFPNVQKLMESYSGKKQELQKYTDEY